MAGMEFDFTADTSGLVSALEAAIGPAEELDQALKGDRDAAAELGAASGEAAAGLSAQAAAMDAAATSTRRMRDEHGLLRDELGRFTRASGDAGAAAADLGAVFRDQKSSGEDLAASLAELEDRHRSLGVTSLLADRESVLGMNSYRHSVEDAHATIRDAERGIDDLQNATSRSEMAAISAAHGLKDLERGGRDAGDAISDLDGAASDAAGAGGGLASLGSKLGPAAMPAAIGGLVVAAAAAAPALVSMGLGFGSFAALAAPALSKVKTGLTAVSEAQAAYTMAKGVEARDPSKSNLEDEAKALATLKTTWAQMPAPVRQAVSSVQQFEHAFSRMSVRSGIQKDALGDIPKALKVARDLLPDVSTLAKDAAPAVSGLLRSLDRGVQSKGFQGFVKSMGSEVQPATRALTNLGGALAGLTGHSLEGLKPISAPFIDSLARLTKLSTPGVSDGLDSLGAALLHVSNGMGDVLKKGEQHSKGQPSFFSQLHTSTTQTVGDLQRLSKGIGSYGSTAGSLLYQLYEGHYKTLGRETNLLSTPKPIKIPVEPHLAAGASLAGVNARKPIIVPVHFKADNDSLTQALDQAQKLKAGGEHAIPVHVKADGADVASSISKATTGKNIDVKGHVTLSGLQGGIQKQIASIYIPDSKVKISVSVAGVAGVKGQMASVVSAAQHDAAAAKGALQSLASAGSAAGAALDAGLAAGISASEGSVVAAATAVASAAGAAIKAAAGISSPSKVWKALGKNMDEGLVLGLEGGKAAVQAAARLVAGDPFHDSAIARSIKKLREDVHKAVKDNEITPGRGDALLNWIDIGNKRLTGLVQRRQHLVNEIKAAQALSKSVRQGAIGSADITAIAGIDSAGVAAQANPPSAPSSIQQGQKADLHSIETFSRDIRKLKKEGLDKQSIKELLAAGVSGGLPAAQQLLQSGKAGVKESAKLQREIIAASKKLGVEGANAAYESGSQIDKGLAAGLKGELSGVVKAIAEMARQLENELRKALGLPPLPKSGHGGAGGGGGGHRHHPPVYTPGGGSSGGVPGLGGGGMHGGPIILHHHSTTTVVLDGQKVGQSVQTTMLRHGRRNVAVGLKPTNRAA